ncbi:MAG: hypothetical protein KAS23_03240 [Anaerohalosphaera sp.]|nr:hypothetical protein [Anaerohalosphaera sp.]
MTNNETSKPKAQRNKKEVLVRYGRMGYLGWFEHTGLTIEKTRTRVVIKTKRGLELGDIVGPHCYKGGQFKCSHSQVADYYEGAPKDYPFAGGGTLVRYATDKDIMENEHLEVSSRDELKCCQKFAAEMKLPMKIVDAEHLLGGERVVLYFTSETRVDFRDLVKKLAREYQTRIELRQIGSRDEARIISDYESCGQECCCRRFLKILSPVNMRMAKVQKATLDPSKISGHCGRLKCCLRYEDETYRELKSKLPNRNSLVETEHGVGKVLEGQILTQLVVVQYEDGKTEAVKVDELKPFTGKISTQKKPADNRRREQPVKRGPKEPEAKVQSPAKETKEQPAENTSSQQQAEGSADAPEKKKKRRRRRRKKNTKTTDGQPNGQGQQQPQTDQPAQQQDNNGGESKPDRGQINE